MHKRSYKQNCALALAGDVIGERWSMLLVRDLLVGPRRYKDLLVSLKGIGTNLLATRLKDLETADIVARVTTESGANAYILTERGRALEPAVLALVRWGLRYGPQGQENFHHRDEWDLVALKALFQPSRATDLVVTIRFRTDDFVGWVAIRDNTVSIGYGDTSAADITVQATVKRLFIGPDTPESLLASGSADNLRRFMSAFALRG